MQQLVSCIADETSTLACSTLRATPVARGSVRCAGAALLGCGIGVARLKCAKAVKDQVVPEGQLVYSKTRRTLQLGAAQECMGSPLPRALSHVQTLHLHVFFATLRREVSTRIRTWHRFSTGKGRAGWGAPRNR
ncbi:hypothetical protein H257_07085 [Aphanomyces astaci]|uniref:Uncharacterized protein n=1 Tax=Aphanomyces astaci TaxID=112090 RepID=W4GJI5_APHAT|nr:hypothetical protein H257_07085 [Aphanomyces astaci]ETV79870.1 hypothetical protein H257_07085 [Aphanomyces astaci]|eukprot:XP_009830806.1 hypothetical protein H257_07085 [Aphanomyces astaci]